MASIDRPAADRVEPTTANGTPEAVANGAARPAESPAGTPPRVLSEAEFQQKNARRLDLIDKQDENELTPEELDELEHLEEEMDAYARVHFSGVEQVLDHFEEQARRLGYQP